VITTVRRRIGSYRARLTAGILAVAGVLVSGWVLTTVTSPRHFWLVFATALVCALALTIRLSARAASPVERLSAAARSIAEGNLRVAVPLDGGGLAELADALTDLRTQMRDRLAESEAEQANLRAVLDGLTDAVLLLHDDRIVFANNATSLMFRPPARGWRDRQLSETELPAPVRGIILGHLDSTEATTEECLPDPSGRTVRVVVMPLNPTERHGRTLVVVSDTTERTRLERVRRDFVANASHELKTPVAAIHLLAESAMHAAEDGDTDQALTFASRIEQESARLSRLVTDLLDLSRLESTPAPESVTDIRAVVDNAIAGHRAASSERGLALLVDDTEVSDEGVFAKADPTDVAVALDNLLDNAITYTESGSVTVSIGADADVVRLTVTDTGIGIPSEDVPRIFERFYRVDRARSRNSGGTGLGLALVRHVAERSTGSVEVASEPDQGSAFTLTLLRAR